MEFTPILTELFVDTRSTTWWCLRHMMSRKSCDGKRRRADCLCLIEILFFISSVEPAVVQWEIDLIDSLNLKHGQECVRVSYCRWVWIKISVPNPLFRSRSQHEMNAECWPWGEPAGGGKSNWMSEQIAEKEMTIRDNTFFWPHKQETEAQTACREKRQGNLSMAQTRRVSLTG